jgi:hypothetical protein
MLNFRSRNEPAIAERLLNLFHQSVVERSRIYLSTGYALFRHRMFR